MASEREEAAGRSGFRPEHPGITLEKIIKRRDIPKSRLATHIGVSRQTLYQVLNGESGVSADMAVRLGRAFGNSARFWLNLQSAYDTWKAESNPRVQKVKRLPEFA